MGTHYGPYVMYILSQLMQKKAAGETLSEKADISNTSTDRHEEAEGHNAGQNEEYFTNDETGALWHKETNLELLRSFCREGYGQARRHGHFIIGTGSEGNYIGIPGRFLIEDQPAGGRTGFTLWQPLRGGEELFGSLEEMDEDTASQVYGYWIASLDGKTLEISEV